MNTEYFVKAKLRCILHTWKKAEYVECPQDLVNMFNAGEILETYMMLEGEYKLDEFYDLCNMVIDEAVESGVMEA